jgi:UDP-N-acetylmuramoyl-tripeptide--D-alanyl-D-alanine ligase
MLGRHSVHTALRAAAVGLADGLDWEEIITGLRFGHTQLRLVAVRGKSGALLLDDTYNASPQSTLAALNLLEELDGRKIAVLGDMLELGADAVPMHEEVGEFVAQQGIDRLIACGVLGRSLAKGAERAGIDRARIVLAQDAAAATEAVKAVMKSGDVILVKASRGMKLEQVAQALHGARRATQKAS